MNNNTDINLPQFSLRTLENRFPHETQSQKQLQQSWEFYFLFKSASTVPHEVYNFDEMTQVRLSMTD